jgi:hypothetical protein
MDEISKVEPVTKKRRMPPRAGMGRPKGSSNKLTTTVKECIEHAFKGVGGAEYLMRQAEQNPTAFMTLLGKVIPAQVHADITSGGKSLQQMQEAVLAALAKKHG